MWSLVLKYQKCSSLVYMYFSFPQARYELCRILADNCVKGAEDRLVSGLRVMLNLNVGSEKLTKAEFIDAGKIIQQQTKRKSSSLDVFKFQDVSILLLFSLDAMGEIAC